MSLSSFLTPDVARRAVDAVEPTILRLMQEEIVSRHDLHIIVAQQLPVGTCRRLHSKSFGDVETWKVDYAKIAAGKLEITARTGLPSRRVQLEQPELLESSDVIYWGSAIVGSIIVACSGVQPYFDEAFAFNIAWMCRAFVQLDVEARRSQLGEAVFYDGGGAD